MSSAGVNFIDFNFCNYEKLFRQVTGQKDTIHNNIFLSNYLVEILSTFFVKTLLTGVFTTRNLIRHALFIPRVNSVMFWQNTLLN